MTANILLLLLAAACSFSPTVAASNGAFVFVHGNLGHVDLDSVVQHGRGLSAGASTSLARILQKHTNKGATGREAFRPGKHKNKVVHDSRNHTHLRFEQTLDDGIPVVDAAMIMHVDESGQVYAVNGEFVAEGSVIVDGNLTCQEAYAGVLDDPEYGTDAAWLFDCELTIVIDDGGNAHKAWERVISYESGDGSQHVEKLYASVVTGQVVVIRPQVNGAMSLRTENCMHQRDITKCKTISTSTAILATDDEVINDAHNYARSTYMFYYDYFGRDSVDDNGKKIGSLVNLRDNYGEAHWDATLDSVVYSVTKGVNATFYSRAPDIVAHEITHGVTYYTSQLVYQDQSGALNEAMSDIFGATFDRLSEKASVTNTWLVGERLLEGATRNMADPTSARYNKDWYPERYQGSADNGGAHWNSGIANLAFVLMVQGGSHPRGKSKVEVTAIDPDFNKSLLAAANIFYLAQTGCLTPMSGFHQARWCTLTFAGDYAESVAAAWEAVGVTANIIAPVVDLSNWIEMVDRGLKIDDRDYNNFLRRYRLGAIGPGQSAVCLHRVRRVNARVGIYVDLRLYYGNLSDPSVTPIKACGSTQECDTGVVTSSSLVYAEANAWHFNRSITNVTFDLQVMCGKVPPPMTITNKLAVTSLSGQAGGESALQVFQLDNVLAGEVVTCNTVGGSGNADLYVRPGAIPYPASIWKNVCASTQSASNEKCATQAVSTDSSVFVSIHAVKSYTDLTLVCRTCKSRGLSCRKPSDCCGAKTACDGPTRATKTCQKAVPVGGKCLRSTQCRRGYACKNGRCVVKTV